MKPREFIKTFNLQDGWKAKFQDNFVEEMKKDFINFCEELHAKENLHNFQNAINHIRMKWDSISNKIPNGLPDGLWKFFYASVICGHRDVICAESIKKQNEARAEKDEYRKLKGDSIKANKLWTNFMTTEFNLYKSEHKEYLGDYYDYLEDVVLDLSDVNGAFRYYDLDPANASIDEVYDAFNIRIKEINTNYADDEVHRDGLIIASVTFRQKCIKYIKFNS